MVPILHAVVLGLVQGLSEFLPISSSGHLLLLPWLFGWADFGDRSAEKSFDVALHLGTLVALVGYFRVDIIRYGRAGRSAVASRGRRGGPDGRIAVLLVASALPAAGVGAVFESSIDEQLGRPWIIAVSLIVFGVVLLLADRARQARRLDRFGSKDALWVGAAQVLALNPGTSRSGITLSAARWRCFDRDAAARMSFLMSVPVVAGAAAYKLVRLVSRGVPNGLVVPMIVGVVVSGVSGWVAIAWLLRLVRTRSFAPFVLYRCAVGVIVLGVIAAGWR